MATPIKRFACGILLLLSAASVLAQSPADELVTRNYKLEGSKIGTTNATETLRQMFSKAGVTIPAITANPQRDDKAIFFNQADGTLHVRASRREIPKIKNALNSLSASPPMVEIDVRLVESDRSIFPVTNRFPTIPGAAGLMTWSADVGVLTEPQFRVAIQQFEKTERVEVVSVPRVTTLSGRQARIEVEQTQTRIFDTPPRLPKDTRPDANPTPLNKGRLPLPPTVVASSRALIIRADSE